MADPQPDQSGLDRFLMVAGDGVDPHVAQNFLDAGSGNVERALELYLDSGGHMPEPVAGNAPRPAHAPHLPSSQQLHDVDEEDNDLDEEGRPVRKADQVKKQRLLGVGLGGADRSEDGGEGGSEVGLLFHPLNPFRHFGAEARGSFGRGGDPWGRGGGGGISKLFQPPLHMIFHGNFADARATAREGNKWLLVNIQREDIFASHMLNRDVWADELVQALVREGFVFWQMSAGLPEAMSYVARYHLDAVEGNSKDCSGGDGHLPHIGVLDPRTQRLLWSHAGALSPAQLAEKLTEVTSTYSLTDHTTSKFISVLCFRAQSIQRPT
ncbi:ubx domain-containing protein 7, partial [Nannochloropsis gaditana CCMP526]|uniref:ubx domain-containing protein 7 n=1 Tax=Nannochloropsis gaditana (strain CCMP526) TaxID=1093141 RepID=UPI00029F5E29